MPYPGEVLTQYQREVFDVEVPPRARRRVMVDSAGNYYSVANPLPVQMSSDIEIGAVEIKDSNTDTRVDVEPVGPYNAILTKDITEFQKQKINNFGTATVAPSATITLATYTVPVGKRFIYSGGIVGGTEVGEFYFDINANTQALVRNSGSNPTIQVRFIEAPEASGGSTVDLKVKNISNKTRTYEANLSGYIVDV